MRADGWVLPFEEVLDWSTFAVRLPEEQALNLTAQLAPERYSTERVLAMRLAGRRAYENHFRTFEAQASTVIGIVAGRQQRAAALSAGVGVVNPEL